ncbi:hypothetical protein NQ317_018990 [Molorchus minor]|uniref:Uncharacterized protein n=1 Tax=Molorchus minor TaxID=1323400 RepID=A0ABQ9JMD5_9CUCU|nr:hypothetical protein NQ317_018990 [Molorchus minor]
MAIKSKTGICAITLTAVAFTFIVVSFCTGYWLVNDGIIKDPQFIRLGKFTYCYYVGVARLWEVCFENFEDFRHQYDYKFTGCWWVFEEEYYIIFDFLLPGFFIATQFFYTLCMTLVLIGGFFTWMYCFCSRDHDRYLLLLLSNGANLTLGGICGLISVSIFGAHGDSRDWMPNWQHNDLSWSFAFACIGSLLLLPAGALFLVEARRARYRILKNSQPPSQYSMEIRKSESHHTDI